MYKIGLLLCLYSFVLFSCSTANQVQVDLTLPYQKIVIETLDSQTTCCHLLIQGMSDCDISINIPSENSIHLKSGKLYYSRNFEWYHSKTIEVLSESCSNSAKMKISYTFSNQYFGCK